MKFFQQESLALTPSGAIPSICQIMASWELARGKREAYIAATKLGNAAEALPSRS